jgi:hypothetical protein
MRYRRLDANGDMTFGQGSANFLIDSPEAVAQSVLTRLRLWTGEWFLDVTEGTPYKEAILGKGTEKTAGLAMRRRVLETPGVLTLDSFSYTLDRDQRRAEFSAEITTLYGATTITGTL